MNKTTDIRGSLVDSAANWDSMGKTKLLKLAEAAAASVPQTEWGMQMSALEGVVDNLFQNDANNQTRLIGQRWLGDEVNMGITLQTHHYTGSPGLRALIRGEFFVSGLTNFPLSENIVGIAIRTSQPVTSQSIWFKWEEFYGSGDDSFPVASSLNDNGMSANTVRGLNGFDSARLSFACSFEMSANSELILWPEFITQNSPVVEDMFLPGSYIQSSVQLIAP